MSEPASHATARAALVSALAEADLEILHMADLAPFERLRLAMGATPEEFRLRVLHRALKALDKLASSLHQRFGVAAQIRVLDGALLSQLAKETDTLANGLMVCGAVGEGSGRFKLGTTASRVLSTAACPVLVVKQPPRERYKRVLVALDMSAASARVLQQARAVALGAELVLLHVVEVPFVGHLRYAHMDDDAIERYLQTARNEALAHLSGLVAEASLLEEEVHLTVMQGDSLATIVQVEREFGCDLIAMGKYGEGALADFLLGSLTKRVLATSSGDVLVSV